jgi:hypothetical protein
MNGSIRPKLSTANHDAIETARFELVTDLRELFVLHKALQRHHKTPSFFRADSSSVKHFARSRKISHAHLERGCNALRCSGYTALALCLHRLRGRSNRWLSCLSAGL